MDDHAARMNAGCHTYEWGISHVYCGRVTCQKVLSHINESCRTHTAVLCHTNELLTRVIYLNVTHMNESWHTHTHTHEWVMSNIMSFFVVWSIWIETRQCCSMLQCVAMCCSVLQCVAVCCSVLQCVAVCCSVLQCVAVCCSVSYRSIWIETRQVCVSLVHFYESHATLICVTWNNSKCEWLRCWA